MPVFGVQINKPSFVTVKEVIDMYANNEAKINYLDPKRILRCQVTSSDKTYISLPYPTKEPIQQSEYLPKVELHILLH